MKRYAIYRTSAAPLSRALGAVAVALAVMAVLAVRFDFLSSHNFVVSLMVVALIGVAALAFAFTAVVQIWRRGGPGLGSAVFGAGLGSIGFALPSVVFGLQVLDPHLPDVSTDPDDPPVIAVVEELEAQPVIAWMDHALQATGRLWGPEAVTEEGVAANSGASRQAKVFPDIVPRRYRIPPGQLHLAAKEAVGALRWAISGELPPDMLDAATALSAQDTSMILALKHDVALRIKPDAVGSLLDVRVRSQSRLRELASSADRIRELFAQIDSVLLDTYGDLARLSVEETDLEADIPVEPFEPDRKTTPVPGFKPYFESNDGLSSGAFELDGLEG